MRNSIRTRLTLAFHRLAVGPLLKELGSFTAFIPRGETYIGPVHFHEISGESLMIMAVPIIALDTGITDGVLMAEVRLKEIWDLVAGIRPGQKGASFIVDDGKRVVAHSDPSVALRGTRFNTPGFEGVQVVMIAAATTRRLATWRGNE